MISKEDVARIIQDISPEDEGGLLRCLHDMPQGQLKFLHADEPETVLKTVRDFYKTWSGMSGQVSRRCLCQQWAGL
jgi:hypothetical protein